MEKYKLEKVHLWRNVLHTASCCFDIVTIFDFCRLAKLRRPHDTAGRTTGHHKDARNHLIKQWIDLRKETVNHMCNFNLFMVFN